MTEANKMAAPFTFKAPEVGDVLLTDEFNTTVLDVRTFWVAYSKISTKNISTEARGLILVVPDEMKDDGTVPDPHPTESQEQPKIKSDGGSSEYYRRTIPASTPGLVVHADGSVTIEAHHVIRFFLDNDFDKGNIFKAMTRLGQKAGVDEAYDKNKIVWFANQLRNH